MVYSSWQAILIRQFWGTHVQFLIQVKCEFYILFHVFHRRQSDAVVRGLQHCSAVSYAQPTDSFADCLHVVPVYSVTNWSVGYLCHFWSLAAVEKELKWNWWNQVLKSVHCSHCLLFSLCFLFFSLCISCSCWIHSGVCMFSLLLPAGQRHAC